MATKDYLINETSTISSKYGKTVIPKTLRAILNIRDGHRILWKSAKRKSGKVWTLVIETMPKP
ncbi:unnamed protein product [marine sediment metagenome]|uniref:SpoVT-AbrB domain-containing protein n=1 Tax=marine sediment metagenome TaxID=412755 RepID=X1NLU3_9ZZZZ